MPPGRVRVRWLAPPKPSLDSNGAADVAKPSGLGEEVTLLLMRVRNKSSSAQARGKYRSSPRLAVGWIFENRPMAKMKSERHQWWPVCVSRHWAGDDGKTGWLRPDGSTARIPPTRLGDCCAMEAPDAW